MTIEPWFLRGWRTTLVALLLLCLCVSSWGRCVRTSYSYSTCQATYGCYGNPQTCGVSAPPCECGDCINKYAEMPSVLHKNNVYYTSKTWLQYGNYVNTYCKPGCSPSWGGATPVMGYGLQCDTQAEADSVSCEQNPGLPNCGVVSDTLLFACSESMVNGQAVSTIYRLSCKAKDGEITECNGKQNIDIPTDGQPVKQLQGTCAQNGLNVGPFGGASPQDSTAIPNGANAECFAITGATCHMRDKVSGNTFTCGCDGSCNVAIRNLMSGNADCTNPYPQPTSSSDSLIIGGSSGSGGESSPSSSGSEGESSPSSSPADSSGDFEYDYTAVLEGIRANTQYTGNEVNDLNGKANTANEYLRQIANKDWNPIINVSPPIVNVGGDTNIINVQGGDTSRAGAEIYRWLTDQNYSVDTSERAYWRNYSDSLKTSVNLFLDSMAFEDSSWQKNADSLAGAVRGMRLAFNAFMDTIGNSAFNDTLDNWRNTIVNNGVLQGQGSNSCPEILTRNFNLEFPFGQGTIRVMFGNIGHYLCTPIAGLSLTLWALGRTLIRFLVAFTCMMWLYRAVTGSGNSGEDDE